MAEAADSDGDTHHPRTLPPLVAHAGQEKLLANSVASGRLHHAWLFSGPQGVGKATMAYKLAAHLLSGGKGGDRLDVDPAGQAARWIGSQSHPDLFVLERAFDRKSKKLKSEIAVSDARDLLQFFTLTGGASQWRVAIIDTADDLNEESANTLLKVMEEPPPFSILILVCNYPGRLLRTIRSRCARLEFAPLGESDMATVMQRLEDPGEHLTADHRDFVMRLAKGSPGLAAELLHSAGSKAFAAFLGTPSLSSQAIVDLGSRFSARSATLDDYQVFHALLESWMAEQARQRAMEGRGLALSEAATSISEANRDTLSFNLDRRHAVIKALTILDRALKAG